MAKRFTDTDKYKKPFIRGLKGPYKVLWDYIIHDCNHAGIWIVDFDIAQIYVGLDMPINKTDALMSFNDGEERIIEINNGEAWFIRSFINEQYGILNADNRVHKSVMDILTLHGICSEGLTLIKPLTSPLLGAKDKYKEKDLDKGKDKDQEQDKENKETQFEIFWDQYHAITKKPKEDRAAAETKWRGLTKVERAKAIEMIAPYSKTNENRTYLKKARTYLGDKAFNNEMPAKKQAVNDYNDEARTQDALKEVKRFRELKARLTEEYQHTFDEKCLVQIKQAEDYVQCFMEHLDNHKVKY